MARYFEWNYDTNEVIEYERTGECNGCGDCCKALIQFSVCNTKPDDDGHNIGSTTDRHGLWGEINDADKPRYMIKLLKVEIGVHQCRDLTDENRCSVHFDKSRICAEWPFHRSHVTPFERCSYSFKEIGRKPME